MNKVRFSLLVFALLALLAIASVQIASADANQVDLDVVNNEAIAHAKNIFRDSHEDDDDEVDEVDEDDYDDNHDDEDNDENEDENENEDEDEDEDEDDDYEDDEENTHTQSESESESQTPSNGAQTPSESETRSAAPTKSDTPANPTKSDTPANPTKSDTPVGPTKSDTPVNPTKSDTPANPTSSAQPQPQTPVIPSDAPNKPSPSPTQDPKNVQRDAVVFLSGVGSQHSSAYGKVTFSCARDGCTSGQALVEYEFFNVPVGSHSFNIYEYGNTADNGRATGRYFLTAPPVRDCASPPSASARAGDLGEIIVPEGTTHVKGSFAKSNIYLIGDKSIIGRGIGLDELSCDTKSDGKDRTNIVLGTIGIAQPEEGLRSSSSSGAAPSSVKGGFCAFSPIADSGIQGSATFDLVAGQKNALQITASFTSPKSDFFYAQIYTYGDLTDSATGASLGPLNYNNLGSSAAFTKDSNSTAPGRTYTLSKTFAGIDLSGSSSVVGRGLAIYTYKDNKIALHAACPIALSGPVPNRVCANPAAANFNQASPCIMAAKLASKDSETSIDVEGAAFVVPAGSLKEDELFIEVYEVDQEFEPPTVGKYSNINITSSIEFQPAGDHFDANNLPTVTFSVESAKGFNLIGLISNDGKTWELLPNLKYDPVKGLIGSVPHFSYVSSGKSKKTEDGGDSNNDVAIGVGVGVGVGGAAIIGAAGFYYYQKNKGSSGNTAAQNDTPLTPQEKYGNI